MPRCGCEKEDVRQSVHSPDVVRNEEPIVYFGIDPTTTENRTIKDLSKSKLQSCELSVCRAPFISENDAREKIFKPIQTRQEGARLDGVLWATAEEIRAVTLGDTNIGAFCVIDDGLESYAAHAVLGYSGVSDKKLMNHRNSARGNLKLVLLGRNLMPLERCPFSKVSFAPGQRS